MATWVQMLAITSALLPVIGAVRNYTAGFVDGVPGGYVGQMPIQELALDGFNTVAGPAAFASFLVLMTSRTTWWRQPLSSRAQTILRWTWVPLWVFVIGAIVSACFLLPFPEVIATASAYAGIGAWITWESFKRKLPFGQVAGIVMLAAFVSSVATGVNGGTQAATYVSFSPPSPHKSGWYLQMGPISDQVYLMPCSDKHWIVVPWSTIASIDYQKDVPDVDTTLLHAIQTGSLPPIGDVLTCPDPSQPPP
jgi:hypothetical protein